MRPPFDRHTISLLAKGDPYEIKAFVHNRQSCAKLVRWHLRRKGQPYRPSLEQSIPIDACTKFIHELRKKVPKDPQAVWLKLLLREIRKHV